MTHHQFLCIGFQGVVDPGTEQRRFHCPTPQEIRGQEIRGQMGLPLWKFIRQTGLVLWENRVPSGHRIKPADTSTRLAAVERNALKRGRRRGRPPGGPVALNFIDGLPGERYSSK
jgi:hypothetical protein